MNKEKKVVQFDIKANGIRKDDDGQEFGQIEAYAAVFGNIDSGSDKIVKGAFKRTIIGAQKRAKSREKRYLFPMLWAHSDHELIGGWFDVSEDDYGLRGKGEIALATQRGREYYALAKAGMSDQLSIIYDVPIDGAKYSKDGIRELLELRLYSMDPVVFAMNDETMVVGVKSMEIKSVCGDTSLPIGPRDASWDGGEAHNQIVDWATDSDGNVDAAKMKQVHLQVDGDPEKITSYGYAFCNISNGKPVINVGGVKACANALSGARNADPGEDADGMKKKVETLYSKINKKYPDDTPLVAPWKDDEKARGRHMQRKTFEDHYNDEAAQDLLEDWSDIWLCSLTCAVFDALTIGDSSASDISDAIDAFKASVMGKFVPQAQDCNLSDYLSDNAYSYTPGLTTMQNGSDGGYGYMSRQTPISAKVAKLREKAGRAISAANQAAIDDHVKGIKTMANDASAAMKKHVKAMHKGIDEMTGGDDDGDNEKSMSGYHHKAGRAVSAANANTLHDMADKAMSIMNEHTKAVSSAADDFANTMQGAESPAFGTGEGVADEDQQEGRGKSRQRSPYTRTPATQNERPRASTALEDVEIPASWLNDLRLHKAV